MKLIGQAKQVKAFRVIANKVLDAIEFDRFYIAVKLREGM